MNIEDGTGTGNRLKIDDENRAFVRSVTKTDIEHANEHGDSYVIHTGKLDVTGSADMAILYLKNNETRNLVVDTLAVAIGTGSALNPVDITIVRDPTAGSIITNAVNVSYHENRNFASSQVLDALYYKGGNGTAFTNGSTIGEYFVNHNSRLSAANTNWLLPQGSAIGINMNPNLSGSAAASIYVVLVTYLQSETE